MSDPPAVTPVTESAVTAAARQIAHFVSGSSEQPWPEPDAEDIQWAAAALEAAVPHLAYAAGGAAGDRIRELEQLAAEVLASFSRTEGGHRARVGQVQIQKWHARLNPAQPWNPGEHPDWRAARG